MKYSQTDTRSEILTWWLGWVNDALVQRIVGNGSIVIPPYDFK
jgi:hypothetical protein